MSYEAEAFIHSMKQQDGTQHTDTVEIVQHRSNNDIVARYKGQYYSAVFNPFSGRYYVDDTYGHLPDYAPNAPFAPEKPPKKRKGKER